MAKLGAEEKMFVFDINLLRQNLLSVFPGEDEVNIVLDFNFLLAMVGNDFVPSLPFLKIKNRGSYTFEELYTNTKSKHPGYGYLIEKETFRINLAFFKDIVRRLSHGGHRNEEVAIFYIKGKEFSKFTSRII